MPSPLRLALAWAPCLALGFGAPGLAAEASAEGGQAATVMGEEALARARAEQVAAWLSQAPSDAELAAALAPDFLAALPPAQLRGVLAELARQGGAARVVEALPSPGPRQGRFRLRFAKGLQSELNLVLEEGPAPRLTGAWFGPLRPALASWRALEAAVAELPGEAALSVWRLPELGAPLRAAPRRLACHRAQEAMPLGSAFKLVVFSALWRAVAEGRASWGEVVALDEGGRSLPSGRLHQWPVGSLFTLSSLAGLMISESDNTATDLLMRRLGRPALRSEGQALGWARPEANWPFLTTRELFVLKDEGQANLRSRYLAASPEGRLALLGQEVPGASLEGFRFGGGGKPFLTDRLEWFGTMDDLAGTWHRLGRRAVVEPKVGGLLGLNRGIPWPEATWPMVGFKGGSEPGVVALSWVARRQDGACFAVAMAWHREDEAVDEGKLVGLASTARELLEAEPR